MLLDKGILKAIWAGLFILCAVLGFLPEQTGANAVLLALLAVLFFVPPALDVWQAWKKRDEKELRLVRNLSALSLASTLALLVANLLSVLASEAVGNFLFYLLTIVSTPMICGQYWVLGLTLWAVLLWCCVLALRHLRKKK